MKDWKAWVSGHPHPKAAKRVLEWLESGDHDEPVWQAADQLVELVVATVNDCSVHVIRFEGVDFDMIERFS